MGHHFPYRENYYLDFPLKKKGWTNENIPDGNHILLNRKKLPYVQVKLNEYEHIKVNVVIFISVVLVCRYSKCKIFDIQYFRLFEGHPMAIRHRSVRPINGACACQHCMWSCLPDHQYHRLGICSCSFQSLFKKYSPKDSLHCDAFRTLCQRNWMTCPTTRYVGMQQKMISEQQQVHYAATKVNTLYCQGDTVGLCIHEVNRTNADARLLLPCKAFFVKYEGSANCIQLAISLIHHWSPRRNADPIGLIHDRSFPCDIDIHAFFSSLCKAL